LRFSLSETSEEVMVESMNGWLIIVNIRKNDQTPGRRPPRPQPRPFMAHRVTPQSINKPD
jgi:hypothetical protein